MVFDCNAWFFVTEQNRKMHLGIKP
jgi:hypothetical protein